MKKIMVCFAAGCLGALANSLAAWAAGSYGITGFFQVEMAPALSPAWIYPRIVWGGLWGLLFLLPLLNSRPFAKGGLISLAPTAVQLLVIFPQNGKALFGLELGLLTPVFVLLFNAVWGWVAAYAIRLAK
jgi:hypothetical protein